MSRVRVEVICRTQGSEQLVGDLIKIIKAHLPGEIDYEDGGYHSRGIILEVEHQEVKDALRKLHGKKN